MSKESEYKEKLLEAIELLRLHPDWSSTRIASETGIFREQVARTRIVLDVLTEAGLLS